MKILLNLQKAQVSDIIVWGGGVFYGELSKTVEGLSWEMEPCILADVIVTVIADIHTSGILSYRAMDSPSNVPRTLKSSI